jgi:hypothetical protein
MVSEFQSIVLGSVDSGQDTMVTEAGNRGILTSWQPGIREKGLGTRCNLQRHVCSDSLLSARPHLLMFPTQNSATSLGPSQHISLWGTFHIQTITSLKPLLGEGKEAMWNTSSVKCRGQNEVMVNLGEWGTDGRSSRHPVSRWQRTPLVPGEEGKMELVQW